MQLQELSSYKEILYSCRFCPMCKPAAEVANVTYTESHSTRGRALTLWRIANGYAEITARDAELLFQSTLDSISESWCVNHFPVSGYVLSARNLAVKKGLMPEPVKAALRVDSPTARCPKSETVLFAMSAAELGNADLAEPAVKALSKIGIKASVYATNAGYITFKLGDFDGAKRQAESVARSLKEAGVKRVITDGANGLLALSVIFPLLGVPLPGSIRIEALAEVLAEKAAGNVSFKSDSGISKVYIHDSRAACHLADEMSTDEAYKPELEGNEALLGRGKIFESVRKIADEAGLTRVFGVWSRALSKSSGADDALWITYPELARKLAISKLDYIISLGAEAVVTDDLLSAEFLKKACREKGSTLPVIWVPELF